MKIAIIVRRLNVKGGTQRQALFFARELRSRGHDVTLYAFLAGGETGYTGLLDELRVVALGYYPKSRNTLIDFWREYGLSRQLAGFIDRDTDILNPHDQVSYRVAYYFKRNVRDVPSVWMMNDMPTKTWGWRREQECGSDRRVSFARRLLWRLLDAYDIAHAVRAQDAIAVLDQRDRQWARQYFRKDAVVVQSGVDSAQFTYHPRAGLDSVHSIKILVVGILFPHRRFEDLVIAVGMLRRRGVNVSCTIVGDCDSARPYAEKLRRLAIEQGIAPYVSFIGRVSDMEIARQYQESDIFVFPSHLQSWGLAVFEAMASGLPVVVSATAGAAEILEDGKTALIVPPKSPEAIAAAVIKLIEDPELYRALSENGRMLVESRLSWRRYTDQMLNIFAAVK